MAKPKPERGVSWAGTAGDVSARLGAWEGRADSGGVLALGKAAALGREVAGCETLQSW